MSKFVYPEVENLKKAIGEFNISLSPGVTTPELEHLFYNKINLNCGGKTFSLPVMDEYNDVKDNNPVFLLHLILQECEFFEEAEDYNVWTKDTGLKKSSPEVYKLYEELKNIVPLIRNLLGQNVRAIPYFEIEFNTGMAKALRNSKIK